MDFLIAPKHRWIYVAIFGVMSVSAFMSYSKFNSLSTTENLYLSLFLTLCKYIYLSTTVTKFEGVYYSDFEESTSLSLSLSLSLFLPPSLLPSVILPLLAILVISLQFFPLFACVNASIPLLSHVMGLIYSTLW